MNDNKEGNMAKELIRTMMNFVNHKHPDWKNAEGNFRFCHIWGCHFWVVT